jgi:hypothetical protein
MHVGDGKGAETADVGHASMGSVAAGQKGDCDGRSGHRRSPGMRERVDCGHGDIQEEHVQESIVIISGAFLRPSIAMKRLVRPPR